MSSVSRMVRPGCRKTRSPPSERLIASQSGLIRGHPPSGFREQARVSDFNWWSYQRMRRPTIPEVMDGWGRTPIDAFITKKLSEKGLTPSAEADRRTLIRRVTYDLLGLPPTPKQVQDFVRDPDPEAYERLVTRLLESPRYSERWARHWLDVVIRRHLWLRQGQVASQCVALRDYVIRSFNQDKAYSRFIKEQIAGDVLIQMIPMEFWGFHCRWPMGFHWSCGSSGNQTGRQGGTQPGSG